MTLKALLPTQCLRLVEFGVQHARTYQRYIKQSEAIWIHVRGYLDYGIGTYVRLFFFISIRFMYMYTYSCIIISIC